MSFLIHCTLSTFVSFDVWKLYKYLDFLYFYPYIFPFYQTRELCYRWNAAAKWNITSIFCWERRSKNERNEDEFLSLCVQPQSHWEKVNLRLYFKKENNLDADLCLSGSLNLCFILAKPLFKRQLDSGLILQSCLNFHDFEEV